MSIGAYEVTPLFADPLFRVDLSRVITPRHVAHVKALEMVPNESNLISKDTYIFEHPELRAVKDAVDEVLGFYAREVMGITQTIYVTQSWSLLNMPGAGMHAHSHSNSILSGSIYFASLPEPPARMVFTRHRCYRQLDLQPNAGQRTIFNAPTNVVTPKAGEMLLFSSELTHMVEPNGATEPRHSIAFNTFVRGKLGGLRNISELSLV